MTERIALGESLVEAARHAGHRISTNPVEPTADECFVGALLAVLLMRYARHLRHYMEAMAIPSVLLVVAVSAYPFQPHRACLTVAWVMVLGVVLTAVMAYVRLARSQALTLVTGSAASRLSVNRDVIMAFVTWVVLPLLAVFAAQYPAVGKALLVALEPFSRVFR